MKRLLYKKANDELLAKKLINRLEQLAQDNIMCAYKVCTGAHTLDEAYKFLGSSVRLDPSKAILSLLNTNKVVYLFDKSKIDNFIKDFNLDKSVKKILQKGSLQPSSLSGDSRTLLRPATGKDITSYLDMPSTWRLFCKNFNIIQFDNTFFYKKVNNNLGQVFKLSRENIVNDIKKYPELSNIFVGIDVDEIGSLEDNIGDTHNVVDKLDLWHRERPFVYINGKLLVGNDNCTHAYLIAQEYGCQLPRGDISKVDMSVIAEALASVNIDVTSFGTGQIIQGVAVVDTPTCFGCSPDVFKDELKNYCSKVYTTSDRHNITRIAKKVVK